MRKLSWQEGTDTAYKHSWKISGWMVHTPRPPSTKWDAAWQRNKATDIFINKNTCDPTTYTCILFSSTRIHVMCTHKQSQGCDFHPLANRNRSHCNYSIIILRILSTMYKWFQGNSQYISNSQAKPSAFETQNITDNYNRLKAGQQEGESLIEPCRILSARPHEDLSLLQTVVQLQHDTSVVNWMAENETILHQRA